MCRSIKTLRRPGESATPDELTAAALQFVRKISGFQKPSKANQEAFQRAVRQVAEASRQLLDGIETRPAPARSTAGESSGSGTTRRRRASATRSENHGAPA